MLDAGGTEVVQCKFFRLSVHIAFMLIELT